MILFAIKVSEVMRLGSIFSKSKTMFSPAFWILFSSVVDTRMKNLYNFGQSIHSHFE